MKTPEDEAFDDLARRQGAWGGGFPAKRAMAADKLQEDLINYGTAWSQDGKRIDPMSVYKEPLVEIEYTLSAAEPAQETVSFPCCGYTDAVKWNQFNGVVQCHMCGQVYTVAQPAQEPEMQTGIAYQKGFHDGKQAALAQPTQEPVALVIDGVLVKSALPEKYTGHLYTAPPQREWNAALDEAAARIGEIKGFGQATQDSFAVFIQGLKR